MAVLGSGEAVYNFIERAVAAACDYKFATVAGCLLRDFSGVAGAGGFCELRLDAGLRKKSPGFVNQAPARVSAATRVGVGNQPRVVKLHIHGSEYWLGAGLQPGPSKAPQMIPTWKTM